MTGGFHDRDDRIWNDMIDDVMEDLQDGAFDDDGFTIDSLAGVDEEDDAPFYRWEPDTTEPFSDSFPHITAIPIPFTGTPNEIGGVTYRLGVDGTPYTIPGPVRPEYDLGVRCAARAFLDEAGRVRQCVFTNGLCQFFCEGKLGGHCTEIAEATEAVQDVVVEANQRLIHGPHPAAKIPETAKRSIIRDQAKETSEDGA